MRGAGISFSVSTIMHKKWALFLVIPLCTLTAVAQHEHHMMDPMSMDVPMSLAFSLHLPMTRNGSGGAGPEVRCLYASPFRAVQSRRVNALTLGLTYDVPEIAHTRLAIGGHLTGSYTRRKLHGLYGKDPMGGGVFIRVYPGLMKI